MNLEGDLFDPSGTLSGGYVNPNDSILLKSEEYKKISREIEEKIKDQKKFEEKLAKLRKDQEYLSTLKSELEAKTVKMGLLKDKVKRNSSVRMQDKHASLENNLIVYKEQIQKLKEMEKNYSKEIEELKQEKERFTQNSEKNMSDGFWKDKVKKMESDLHALNKEITGLKETMYKSEAEKENIEKSLEEIADEYKNAEKMLEDLNQDYNERKKNYQKIKKEFDELNVFIYFILYLCNQFFIFFDILGRKKKNRRENPFS